MSYSNYMNRYKDFETLLSNLTVQYTSLEIYSPVELFCSNVSNECKAKDSFEPLYFNSDHLTIKGSDLVIQDLLMHYPIN